MLTRSFLKLQSARLLNALSPEELFERFQVTRVGEITGLDVIGIPVWAATRPCALVISVTSGKSMNSELSRAGAIAEAIEYATFESPQGLFSVVGGIATEPILHMLKGQEIEFPSDRIWLGYRITRSSLRQKTSNGQAVAGSLTEALLAGLYECVERDAVTIRTRGLEEYNRIPPRHDLRFVEGSLAILRERLAQVGIKLFLFSCSFDIRIPVYWAVIVDPSGQNAPFAGQGCHLDPRVAAERAILEAIQSRLVYISGARDDILRRNFDLMRNQDPGHLIDSYSKAPAFDTFGQTYPDMDPETELRFVVSRLSLWKDKIYYKHIELPYGLHAVKVIIDGLEEPITPAWRPGRWLDVKKFYEAHADIRRPDAVRDEDRKEKGRDLETTGIPG